MNASDELATARLHGHRAGAGDLQDLARLYRDRQVLDTLSPGGEPIPDAVIHERMQAAIRHWDDHGFGIWFFRGTDDGEFAGRAGLRVVDIEGARETELLYAFMPESWGRGIATEASYAITEQAFGRLRLESLVAYTLHGNLGSRRVMEKLGFAYERDIVHAGLDHVLYRRSRSDWTSRERSSP